jgi:hypothetical protein
LRSANLALRLPPSMRANLIAAANRNKRRSVSEEIVRRLQSTLVRDRNEADRPRHIQALSEVVARIALGLEARTGLPWNDDRYTQEQLSKGMDFFLYTYSRGESVVPLAVTAEAARVPAEARGHYVAQLGESVAGGIISLLKLPPKPPDIETLRLMEQGRPPMYYPESWWTLWELEQSLRGFSTKSPRRRHK